MTRTFSMRGTASELARADAWQRTARTGRHAATESQAADTGSFGSVIETLLSWHYSVAFTGVGRGSGGIEPRAMPSSDAGHGAGIGAVAVGARNGAAAGLASSRRDRSGWPPRRFRPRHSGRAASDRRFAAHAAARLRRRVGCDQHAR